MYDIRQWWRWAVVGILAIALVLVTIWAVSGKSAQTILPIVISVISLIVSLISAFRDQVFPFQLKLLPGTFCFARHSAVSSDKGSDSGLDLVLPLSFINVGYGDGVIEGLAVKVLDDTGAIMLYRPVMEIDLKAFMQGPSVPSKANLIGAYMPFPLHAKQSLQRAWLFTQETAQNPYPKDQWHPGHYKIEYFAKEGLWRRPKRLSELDLTVSESHIEMAQRGVAVMIGNKNITP